MVYEPSEDSFLLLKHVGKYANGIVLDMGTGSGILAEEAAKTAEMVYAADIDGKAVDYCKKRFKQKQLKSKKIIVVQSDLFSYFAKKSIKFDLIIFNPPYLPADPNSKVKDIALDGGKHGYEVLEEFLNQMPDYLKDNGKCIILFSSLTKKEKVDDIIAKKLLVAKQIDSEKLDFEELFVYEIGKSSVLIELAKNKITDLCYFAKGKRGLVFTGKLGKTKIAVKIKNPDSRALNRMNFEAEMLEKLNKHNIGPKLLFS